MWRRQGAGDGLVLLTLGLVLAGCRSGPAPAPRPEALVVAERTLAQAERLSAARQWPAAVREWRRAADRFALLDEPGREAGAWHQLAQAQRAAGQVAEARSSFESAAALNRRVGRTNDWWRNQVGLLQLEAQTGDTNALAQRWTGLRALPSEGLEADTMALLWNEEGLWHLRAGRWPEAEERFEAAARRLPAGQGALLRAALTANRAWLREREGRGAEALELWRAARAAFRVLGDAEGVATALLGEGRVLVALQREPVLAGQLLRAAARSWALLGQAAGEQEARRLLATLR